MAELTSAQKNIDIVKSHKTPEGSTEVLNKIHEETKKLSNQLDELRRGISEARAENHQQARAENTLTTETLQNIVQSKTEETKNHITNKFEQECKTIRDNIKHSITTIAPPTTPPGQGEALLAEKLQPLVEKMESMSSELRTIRTQKDRTPSPVKTLQQELEQTAINTTQQVGPLTYAAETRGPHSQNNHPQPQRPYQPPRPTPNFTLIVSSSNPNNTGETILEEIREVLDTKNTGARVDRAKKAKNQKIIIKCRTKEDLNLVQQRVQTNKTQIPKTNDPLVDLRRSAWVATALPSEPGAITACCVPSACGSSSALGQSPGKLAPS
ncbi:unnamed protein product [Diatraea saccharalis]|uniref:Uncharacterized protein n=1 Tax=Diatraea saccharalis TaxID=40085 RepID=A0A9N9WFE4_9NEOP|nr:unnamed protein product [Diatraea saccharalis]